MEYTEVAQGVMVAGAFLAYIVSLFIKAENNVKQGANKATVKVRR